MLKRYYTVLLTILVIGCFSIRGRAISPNRSLFIGAILLTRRAVNF
jgi:hypothetical protein